MKESNPQPTDVKSVALPIELIATHGLERVPLLHGLLSHKIQLESCRSPAGYWTVLQGNPHSWRRAYHPWNCFAAIEGIYDSETTLSRTGSRVGFGRTAAPPAPVQRPEFPLPSRESGSSTTVLSLPHASPLPPALLSLTDPSRGRGGLHGLTRQVETWLARVSGLPRFDRITAAVTPMRDS